MSAKRKKGLQAKKKKKVTAKMPIKEKKD